MFIKHVNMNTNTKVSALKSEDFSKTNFIEQTLAITAENGVMSASWRQLVNMVSPHSNQKCKYKHLQKQNRKILSLDLPYFD